MNLKKYSKSGKSIVIELDNGVEYLIDAIAENSLQENENGTGADKVALVRLYDQELRTTTVKEIETSLSENGVIDYLDKKTSKFATIEIVFPEITQKFGLALGDYVDLEQMKSFTVDTWGNWPSGIQIKFIDHKDKSVIIETPPFKESKILLRLDEPYEAVSKINNKKYILTLREIGDSK